jgi:hypothetical protein
MTANHFLANLFRKPYAQLALGARVHAIAAGRAGAVIPEVFKRDRSVCHCCGVSIPGAMEVDALDGNHSRIAPDNLKTICTFCHYARHPIWAASRRRIRVILAPDLSQDDICRIAWACFFLEGEEAGPHVADDNEALRRIYDDIDLRERGVEQTFGTTHPEALIEALMAASDKLAEERRETLATFTEASLRYWPSTDLTAWHAGRFRMVNTQMRSVAASGNGPMSEAIKRAARGSAAELADQFEARKYRQPQ